MHFYGSPVLKLPNTDEAKSVDHETGIFLLEYVRAHLQSMQIDICEVLLRRGEKYSTYNGINCRLDTRKFTREDAEILHVLVEEEIQNLIGDYGDQVAVIVQISGHPLAYQTRAAEEKDTPSEEKKQ